MSKRNYRNSANQLLSNPKLQRIFDTLKEINCIDNNSINYEDEGEDYLPYKNSL